MSAHHRALGLALGLALLAGGASAQTYQILRGTLSGPDGRRDALAGSIEADALLALDPEARAFLVPSFSLQAGDHSFTAAPPIRFNGLAPAVVPTSEQSHVELLGDDVQTVLLRSGGEVVRSSDADVTFRFLDFRSDASDGGHAVGVLGNREPRRLHLAGTLYEVQQTFQIRDFCHSPGPILQPASGDGVPTAPHVQASAAGQGRTNPNAGGGGVIIIIVPVVCAYLVPVASPADQALGRFELVSTAARPIDIDVRPAQANNVVLPGAPGRVPVAILGEQGLDVRDVDETSLRLGEREAEPSPWHGRELARLRDGDGDGDRDLVARFPIRDTGIAFGDDLICLVAQTFAGDTLEGCDAIRTLPGR